MITFPFIMPVRGVSFFQNKIEKIAVNDVCTIVPEPFNEFDSNACAVFVNNDKIGYVPKPLAPRIKEIGSSLTGVVCELVGPEGNKGVRVKIKSTIKNDDIPESLLEVSSEKTFDAESKVFSKSGRFIGFLVSRTTPDTLFIEDSDGDRFNFPISLTSLKE